MPRGFQLCRRGRWRCPACRRPTRGRHAIAEGAQQHRDEVQQRHGHERRRHAHAARRGEVLHQPVGQRRTDHRAAAESHDGKAGGHAASIGKPLDQRGHGRDVAQAEAEAADHAAAQPQQPELVQMHAQRAQQQSARPAQRGHHAGLARARGLQPVAEQRGGRSQHHEEQRIGPPQHGLRPVAGGGEEVGEHRRVGRAGRGPGYTQ